jgi:hypothetical protein
MSKLLFLKLVLLENQMPPKTPINLRRQSKPCSGITKNAQFVVNVRSTGLFVTDPVRRKQRAKANYFKTGHTWSRWPVLRIQALLLSMRPARPRLLRQPDLGDCGPRSARSCAALRG